MATEPPPSPPKEERPPSPSHRKSDTSHTTAAVAANAAAAAEKLKRKALEKAHLPHRKSSHALDQIAGTYRVEGHKKALLHGNLHIKLIKCQGLKNMDCTCFLAPSCLVDDVSDPYIAVYAGEHRIAKSSYKMNDLNPVYNEDFYVPMAYYVENLRFEVKDRDFNLYAQVRLEICFV